MTEHNVRTNSINKNIILQRKSNWSVNGSAVGQVPLSTSYVVLENLTQESDNEKGLSFILPLFVHSYAIWLI